MRRGAVDLHLGERHTIATGPGDVIEADRGMAEVKLRQLFQAMPMQAGFLRVGDQHRVIDRRRHWKAGTRQHHHVELGVLEDLQHRRIGQQRRDHRDRLGQLDLLTEDLMPSGT